MSTAAAVFQVPPIFTGSGAPNVYTAIAAVSAELATSGIAKDRKNEQQGYKFRGIDDVYNALAPILSKHGLVILPRMLSREQAERQSAKGGVIFCVVVEAEFDFVSAVGGSRHTTKAYGEAMDSADKATNKAMSAAYKYTAFQTFCIPTEGDNDADARTHEVVQRPAPLAPAGYDDWLTNLIAVSQNGLKEYAAMWNASPPAFRVRLAETQPGRSLELQNAAKAVDKAKHA